MEKANLGYCSQFIPDSMWGHTCSCKATVIEDGKAYCTRHSKAGRERQKQKQDARYKKFSQERDAYWQREGLMQQILGGIPTEKLEAHADNIREFIKALSESPHSG